MFHILEKSIKKKSPFRPLSITHTRNTQTELVESSVLRNNWRSEPDASFEVVRSKCVKAFRVDITSEMKILFWFFFCFLRCDNLE